MGLIHGGAQLSGQIIRRFKPQIRTKSVALSHENNQWMYLATDIVFIFRTLYLLINLISRTI
jgi:hypothetical protein